MALKHTGKCIGGPYDGQEWTYFAEEMPVTQNLGNPVQGQSWIVSGHYRHDGYVWVWYGPSVKRLSD